jgi:hypothetical protein
MGEDPHLRARDEDRDRTVEEIEAAYVDGQITDADRDLRVGNALRAGTLGELQLIVRDLQPDPDAPPPGSRAGAPRTRPLIAAAGVAGVLLAAWAAAHALGSDDDGSTDGPAATATWTQAAGQDPTPTGDPTLGYTMSPAGVRAFIVAYEQQFGTSEVLDAVLYADDRILLEVPVRGKAKRHEDWTYNGEFTQDDDATANGPFDVPLDLRDLNAKLLFENIERARAVLNVEGAAFTHVNLTDGGPFDEVAVANIYVANDFSESGYLRTALTGTILRRYPYGS